MSAASLKGFKAQVGAAKRVLRKWPKWMKSTAYFAGTDWPNRKEITK